MDMSDTTLPLVSVGIPTYNRPEGLRRTLECITNQTHTNLEIIVSDNCSPDPRVEQIAREFQQRYPQIRYYRQPEDKGGGHNFVFVLSQAHGKYFMWAADDDEWDARFIDSMVKVLEAHKNVSVAHCQTTYKLILVNNRTVLPTFLQGVPLDSPFPRPFKRRSYYAVDENFGELFYGIYRKKCLIDDVGHNTLNIESNGFFPGVLKALLNGDAYVSRDFYFIKGVTTDVFLWTYLCAKKKSILATNTSIEKMLEEFRDRKSTAPGETIISRLRRYQRIARSIFELRHFHWQYLRFILNTIDNLNIPGKRLLSLHTIIFLLRDLFWSAATKIKWGFY